MISECVQKIFGDEPRRTEVRIGPDMAGAALRPVLLELVVLQACFWHSNVLPGWIDSLPVTEERRQSVPMQRYGKSEEIAATVAFLASDGAGYITGQNIRVDGGLTRSI